MNGRRHAFPLSRILSCRDQRNIRLAFDAENGMDSGNEERRREKEERKRKEKKRKSRKIGNNIRIYTYICIYISVDQREGREATRVQVSPKFFISLSSAAFS